MKLFPLFFSLSIFLIVNGVSAQIDKKTQDAFDQFANQNTREFNNFQDTINEKFTEELKKQWKQFYVFEGVVNPMKPKPKTPIMADTSQKPSKPTLKPCNPKTLTPSPKTPPKELPLLNQIIPKTPNALPIYPPHLSPLDLNSFGAPIKVYAPITSFHNTMQSISNEEVAIVWEKLSKEDFKPVLEGITIAKENYNLNDWGVFILVKDLSEKIMSNLPFHQSSIMNVFVLNQMGYDAKIAYTQDRLFCIVEVEQQLYGVQYVEVDSKSYYFLEDNDQGDPIKSIKTYQANYSKDLQKLDLTIRSPLRLPSDLIYKSVSIWNKDQIKISINNNTIDFYNHYPQMELSAYAHSAVNKEFKESMGSYFYPKINGKSEEEAIAFILNFCQFTFDYANDMDQFGYEKPFFCEENFYYPKNDCEDRSILFSFLMKEVLNKEVILLLYPGHIATAVCIEKEINGDYFLLQEKKYYVCDPTYIGASIGMTMPQFLNCSPEIIYLSK